MTYYTAQAVVVVFVYSNSSVNTCKKFTKTNREK